MGRQVGKAIKTVLYSAASGMAIPRYVHRRFESSSLSILMYHAVVDVPPSFPDWCFLHVSRFRKQMEYMAKHFEVLSLQDAITRLENGNIRRPLAAVTFDDGYMNNFTTAFPVLEHLGIPATVFVCTELVDSSSTVWFCRLVDAIARTRMQSLTWGDVQYSIQSPRDKAATSVQLQRRLKDLPADTLFAETRAITSSLGCDPDEPVRPDSPFRMLDTYSIGRMRKSGLITFGAHGCSHAILTRLPDTQRRDDIIRSARAVQDLNGNGCNFFAYPNGDYDELCLSVLREIGVRAAFTTVEGPNYRSTPQLQFRRYGVGCHTSMAEFKCTIHHLRTRFSRVQ